MKLFASLLVASAAASKQSVTTLSSDERASLRADLDEWREKFGAVAAAQGLLPPATEGATPLDADTDALQRFYDNNVAIEDARRNNPHASFDNQHPYALLTEAEFKTLVVGLSFQDNESDMLALPLVDVDETAAEPEASVDWTAGKCVNPVRNQGQCGSCWAFSVIGAAESAHCIATGEAVDLSEQQVTSCSTEGGSHGCNGGWPAAALRYVVDGGVCLDRDYPYVSGDTSQTGTCMASCTKKKLRIGAPVRVTGEAGLTSALNTQPVSVIVEAGNSVWQNYRSGVVTSCPGSRSDHAVVAVGYDGSSYKIRNSWGSTWGEDGHIRLQRGVGGTGMCNVVEMAVFPNITGSTPQPTVPRTTTTPKPTVSPSTRPTSSKPTTRQPRPECASCSRCFYPAANECLRSDYKKSDCDYYNRDYGTVWCGN